jgi:SPP1 family predicted phage head-tail adaptor
MKIGEMDTRLTLLQPSSTVDAFGQPNTTFSSHGKVWAKRFARNAGEVIIGDQIVQVIRSEFTIRYKGDLDETWEVQHDGRTYRILGVIVIGRKRFMKLICQEHG